MKICALLSNLYNQGLISRRLDYCQDETVSTFKKCKHSLDAFLMKYFEWNTRLWKWSIFYSSNVQHFLFPRRKIHLRSMHWGRGKGLVGRKLVKIKVLNAKRTISKKMNVSFIVRFCLSKYSFRLYFFNSSHILKKKINVPFIVHFCIGKYNSSAYIY